MISAPSHFEVKVLSDLHCSRYAPYQGLAKPGPDRTVLPVVRNFAIYTPILQGSKIGEHRIRQEGRYQAIHDAAMAEKKGFESYSWCSYCDLKSTYSTVHPSRQLPFFRLSLIGLSGRNQIIPALTLNDFLY